MIFMNIWKNLMCTAEEKPSEFRDIILRRFRAFHSGGNLFECSFSRISWEELMLYAMFSDQQIMDFYQGN